MKSKFVWLLRLTAAAILLQTLFFKFTGAPESIYIFSTLGVEPYGRLVAGFSELIASILLIVPGLELLGAGMAIGIMCGAILSHIAFLGIIVQDDGGLLFALACIVLLASSLIVFLEKKQIPYWFKKVQHFLPSSNQ
jgi:uncharacterized membrane protein YphA (DoxX/SURF4 family)